MYFMGLSKSEKASLEMDVVSNEARLKLTRLIRKNCQSDDNNLSLIKRNQYINVARAALQLKIARLEPDDVGMYENEEFAWHFAETELAMRRPNTVQLFEILGDLLQMRMLSFNEVNSILQEDNVSARFEANGFDDDVVVRILTDLEIEEDDITAEHSNVRLLFRRMESALENGDYPGVLHASSNVFETLAKLVFSNPNTENQTLGSLFEGYRNRSQLPGPILDYILEIYKRRNSEPLAGHGSTIAPTISATEATTLIEITKMCVRLERRLALEES